MSSGQRKAIIIGASSGIGAALAKELSARGYALGLTARRTEKMEKELSPILSGRHLIRYMDVADTGGATQVLHKLLKDMQGVDLIIINAAVSGSSGRSASGKPNGSQRRDTEQLIQINVMGFTVMILESYRFFQKQGRGHIVGISSVAAMIPHPNGSAYNASKAFVSNYIESMRLRIRRRKEDITLTDVRPGFVFTPMTRHNKRMFWASDADKVARQITDDIEQKKEISHVSRRWNLIVRLFYLMPRRLLLRILLKAPA